MGVNVHSQSFWECFACQAQSPPHFSAGPSTLQRARHKNPTSSYIPVGCRVNSILLSPCTGCNPRELLLLCLHGLKVLSWWWQGLELLYFGREVIVAVQTRAGEDKLVHLPRGDKVRGSVYQVFTCEHHSVNVSGSARQVKVTSGGPVPAGSSELGEVGGGHRRLGREPLLLG